MSSLVVNGPGLRRRVPSGKVPRARWMYGGAVQARADGDLEAGVEDRAEVLRREGLGHDERERTDVRIGVPAAGDAPAVGILGPVDDLLEQLDLVAPQAVRPALGDPGDAGGQAGDAQHVRRAPFEEVGELESAGSRSTSRRRSPPRARANPAVGPGADVEGAGAGRAVERLVAGEGEQVDRRGAEVDRHHARRLGRVDQEQAPASRTIAAIASIG